VRGIERIDDPMTHRTVWRIALDFYEAVSWERERLEALLDGIWLAAEAVAGSAAGPLAYVYRAIRVKNGERCALPETFLDPLALLDYLVWVKDHDLAMQALAEREAEIDYPAGNWNSYHWRREREGAHYVVERRLISPWVQVAEHV
jgi:hypothetical protein